jgi:tRNA(Ile)-lysidine synthase
LRENKTVIERVRKAISRHRMVAPGQSVIAAVSGGADSVCMLHVLLEAGVKVSAVAHFNHKLRGEESDEDERFVSGIAARLGIAFYRGECLPGAGNLEQEARKARRGFLGSLLRQGTGDRVALAHTRDDQAETVLFRVLRGSGLAGLAGIHPVTADGFIRPLIGVTRREVLEYLKARDLAWREDSSNRDVRFARNRIRHQLLPQLARDWNPAIVDALANLADLAFEEESFWANREMSLENLRDLSRAEARRAVRRAVGQVKGDLRGIEFSHVESVIEMNAPRIALPGVDAVCSGAGVRMVPAHVPAVEVTVPGTYQAPDGASEIRLEPCDNLKLDLSAPLILRGWRPGDHYLRQGKSRDQKIKEMLRGAGVPSWRRPFWPILDYGGRIIWARQFGPAEGARIRVTETLRPHL